ncbi:MFS transporter [Brevibacillus centrosporus]|uniref:MFS transporter n=1 Tax=Brevibacillus centrosporus TaxID=54910 RepID=UPI003985BD0D
MENNRHGLMLLSILTGTFLVPVNSTMIAVGLPSIVESLHSSLTHASWIITVYLIVMTVLQPIAGKLGDIYGNREMFLLGMLLFLLSSIACLFTMNLLWLIIFRAVQAVGGALAAPNASAIIRYVTPREKMGKTFGMFGFSMGIGAALGPLMGSILISLWGWTSIFWINVPFALVSLCASFFLLPAIKKEKTATLDIYGSVLLGISLISLILLVTHNEYRTIWTLGLLCMLILLFIRQEKKCEEPLIQFQLFKNRMFTSANFSILFSNAIMYSTILVMPILLQNEFHFSVETIGVLLFVFSLSMSLFSWVGGYLTDRVGKKMIVLLSFLFSAVAVGVYVGFYSNHSLATIAIGLVIGGLGAGIGSASMQTASLQAVSKEMSGVASGIFSTFRYVGGMIASVLVSLLMDYHLLFYTLFFFALSGIPVARGLHEPSIKESNG